MRPHEARLRLQRAGWQLVRQTSNRHEVWRRPDGALRLMSFDRRSADRNVAAEIRQAERAAAAMTANAARPCLRLSSQLLSTTAAAMPPELQQESLAMLPEINAAATSAAKPLAQPPFTQAEPLPPESDSLEAYRGAATAAELYCNAAMGQRLGGAGATVRIVEDADGSWLLTPDRAGRSRLCQEHRRRNGKLEYRVTSKALAAALPITGRATLPVRRTATGYVLLVDELVPVPIKTQAWRQPAAVPVRPPQLPAVAPQPSARPATQHGASLDDLKTALELVRSISAELGAELLLEDGRLRARIVL